MLQQILIRTPIYVWVILAALVYRGVLSSRDREVAFWKLFILPAVMPLLTLPDLALKFGSDARTVAIWAGGAALAALLTWQFSSGKVTPAQQAGNVMVRGSWLPLAAMLAVFIGKYVLNVMLVVLPHARHDAQFAALACALFGVFNGVFFGWVARDTSSYLQARAQSATIQAVS
jgi:hypothetical protein